MQKTLSLPSVQLVDTMCASDRDTCRATGSPEYQLMGKEQHVPVLSQLCRQMRRCQGALSVPAKLPVAPQLPQACSSSSGSSEKETRTGNLVAGGSPHSSTGDKCRKQHKCQQFLSHYKRGGKTILLFGCHEGCWDTVQDQDEYKEMSP